MKSKTVKATTTLIIVLSLMLTFSCDRGKFNVFTVQDDKELGDEVHAEIEKDPATYPILDKTVHSELYNHLYRIRDVILASPDIKYKNEFNWEIYIIHDDNVINAFAIPGGRTYYYTGLLKFLEDEASLAGVMAHEVAHADWRHSTARLSKMYSYQTILSVILGDNPSLAAEIAANLALGLTALAYSRQDEYEADEYSLRYLGPAEHDPRGVAYFFEMFDLENPPSTVSTYLSTHPYAGDRITEIYRLFAELGYAEGNRFTERYQQIKALLP
ncbi:MAG: M48 family metalloprotease [Bacteroidetes bacterium]|nr:M48 family metalloprotease [Bacteroidota bacterium]